MLRIPNQSLKVRFAVLLLSFGVTLSATANSGIIKVTPTNTNITSLRGGEGVFRSPRRNGKTHAGVDIVADQSCSDKNEYRVVAVASGFVAYAGFNGENPEDGYGYTVIIDHRDRTYTLYAHLAALASSDLVKVKVGDYVTLGQLIGYMADLGSEEMSSGNANRTCDRIQFHFEEFMAAPGRTSPTGEINTSIKKGAIPLDPTSDLMNNGYKVQTPAMPLPPTNLQAVVQ